jgi:low temperature requirement protein LtrA
MWWIYFHKGAEAGSEQISKSSEPGRLARLAYTYLHMPIVAGIIVAAVADELVLKHPSGIPISRR